MIGAVTGAVNVLTPCLGICRINQRSQLCEGCRRSPVEVAEWLFYSNEKKLAIMRDSSIGAYGVIALVLVLAAKVGALADLNDIGVVMSGLICAAAASRAAMPAMMRWLPPVRGDGLAAEAGSPATVHVWTGIAIAVILSVLLLTWSGLVALPYPAISTKSSHTQQ